MADLNVTLGEETQNEAESNNNPVVKQEPHNSSEKDVEDKERISCENVRKYLKNCSQETCI